MGSVKSEPTNGRADGAAYTEAKLRRSDLQKGFFVKIRANRRECGRL